MNGPPAIADLIPANKARQAQLLSKRKNLPNTNSIDIKHMVIIRLSATKNFYPLLDQYINNNKINYQRGQL